MQKFTYTRPHTYKNNGQDIESGIAYALTGQYKRADNIASDKSADVLNYQIKSARATVCKGADVEKALESDKATAYIYGTQSGIAYVMTKSEYLDFVKTFSTTTQDSRKNGGAIKTRLRYETETMLDWLERRA